MANPEIVTPDDQELETLPETTADTTVAPGVLMTHDYLNQLTAVAEGMDKFIAAKDKIWNAIIRLTKDGDWVVFQGKAMDGTVKSSVCLTGAGADRVGAALGVSFINWKSYKEASDDDKGPWYRWWYEVDASFAGRTIRAIGRAGSRDKFFGRAHGEFKQISDIDESNIKMAAYHNAMKEGIKLLFGLRSIPLAEFEKGGVKLAYASRVELTSRPTTIAQEKVEKKPFYAVSEVLTFPEGGPYKVVAEIASIKPMKTKAGKDVVYIGLIDPATQQKMDVNYFGSPLAEVQVSDVVELPVIVKVVGDKKYFNTSKDMIKLFDPMAQGGENEVSPSPVN